MRFRVSGSGWKCRCGNDHGRFACRVAPSPEVMAALYMEYRRSAQFRIISFDAYLESIGFTDPSVATTGMDDAFQFVSAPGGPQRLAIPQQPVTGEVKVKVLLVDFPDRPGALDRAHYQDLLFSERTFPTGSMRDFYKEASHGRVDVTGDVHGWLRMPQPYGYYTNNESGTNDASYPNNASRLAEDAVRAAIAEGVAFDAALDKFGRGIITALFIIHAGRGAEIMQTVSEQKKHIWSHKWNLQNPVEINPNLSATIYLTVPHDCKVGVCAHELGHLAFEWQDFYDPNYNEDGSYWSGTGVWDLMAGGSYNGNGTRPAHPAPLHKLQHGWITAVDVRSSSRLRIPPYTATTGEVYKLSSPKYKPVQYLLLENRKKIGFDFDLPGEGLLVWKVDETMEMEKAPNAGATAGLSIIQADGLHQLEQPVRPGSQGDAGDPFPGKDKHFELSDIGDNSTSFPGVRSGITLSKINIEDDGSITLDVSFAGQPPQKAAKLSSKAKKAAKKKKVPPAKKAKASKAKTSKVKTGKAKASKAKARKRGR